MSFSINTITAISVSNSILQLRILSIGYPVKHNRPASIQGLHRGHRIDWQYGKIKRNNAITSGWIRNGILCGMVTCSIYHAIKCIAAAGTYSHLAATQRMRLYHNCHCCGTGTLSRSRRKGIGCGSRIIQCRAPGTINPIVRDRRQWSDYRSDTYR
ncbi:hypothetical protein D3C72_1510960 [compost metagenome]